MTGGTTGAAGPARLIWFLHFHKAGGSSVVRLATENGEVLPATHANGNAVGADGKIERPWELTAEGLARHVDQLRADGVTFVATEWGVPDLDALTSLPGVVVVTVLRDPVARLLSGFFFDHRAGFTRETTPRAYADHHAEAYTRTDYYLSQVLGPDWRSDTPLEHRVQEAARRLLLLDHVAFLEQDGAIEALATTLGWPTRDAHAQRFRRNLPRRVRSSLRWLRRGRLDLARRAVSASPRVDSADRAWLYEQTSADRELLARVGAAALSHPNRRTRATR